MIEYLKDNTGLELIRYKSRGITKVFPLKRAISWWSSLNYWQHTITVYKPENIEWYNKGMDGIINMYLNSLK